MPHYIYCCVTLPVAHYYITYACAVFPVDCLMVTKPSRTAASTLATFRPAAGLTGPYSQERVGLASLATSYPLRIATQ